jgi:ethanolamine ammonia-lyase large subunit
MYKTHTSHLTYDFKTLRNLMAKASPLRSGDYLAGVGAVNNLERIAAQWVLAEVPLKQFLNEALVPYEQDEVTRLIIDEHDSAAFAPVSHLTVGDFRNWLLSGLATTEALTAIAQGLTPEMVVPAVSKVKNLRQSRRLENVNRSKRVNLWTT